MRLGLIGSCVATLALNTVVLCVVGCGSDQAGPDDAPLGERGRLEILPAPNMRHAALVSVDRDAESGPSVLPLRYDIALGLGDGYAEDLELRLQNYAEDDACDIIVGSFQIDDAVPQGDAVAASWTSPTTIALSPRREGQSEVIVRGRMTVADLGALGACADLFGAAEQPFELRIQASVMRTPPAVQIDVGGPCENSAIKYMQSGATLQGSQARAIDQNGEPFAFANATPSAQVPLTVVADPDADISIVSEREGVAGLVVEGPSGPVTVTSATGTAQELELVGVGDVTSAEVAFGLGGGSPVALVDGGVYDGANGAADFIFALSSTTYRGTAVMCTRGRPGDFRMSAATETTCVVPSDGERHLQKFFPEGMDGVRVGVDLRVDRSGVCEFTLDAPEFGDGQGWATSLAVTIDNAEELAGTDRG